MQNNNKKEMQSELSLAAKVVNGQLEKYLALRDDIHPLLLDAVKYALIAPGKRIRAAVVQWVCKMLCGEIRQEAIISACAIEAMHTYSLVHDDLPAMDNDDLRRGRPTLHKKYNEATAILAGDALQSMAFEMLSMQINDSKKAIKLVGILANFSGSGGMISGQIADIEAENAGANIETIKYIHNHKTAMMFAASAAMGAICADAESDHIDRMLQWGIITGLCFQIVDDILDVESTSEQMGKTVGKDVSQGKATWPAIEGLELSKQRAETLVKQATELLKPYGKNAELLTELTSMLQNRTK